MCGQPTFSAIRIVEALIIGSLAAGLSIFASFHVMQTKLDQVETVLNKIDAAVLSHDTLPAHREASILIDSVTQRLSNMDVRLELVWQRVRDLSFEKAGAKPPSATP